MDKAARDGFITKWNRYFGKTPLPITFYYTDDEGRAEPALPVQPLDALSPQSSYRKCSTKLLL